MRGWDYLSAWITALEAVANRETDIGSTVYDRAGRPFFQPSEEAAWLEDLTAEIMAPGEVISS